MFVRDGLIEASLLFLMPWRRGGAVFSSGGVNGNTEKFMAGFQVEATEGDRKGFTSEVS